MEIVTLKDAVYISVRNDISFILAMQLSLYEHQSTWNPNLPLRFLEYIADQYSGLVVGKNIYGSKIVRIPAPRFLIFYNGTGDQPDRQVLKLSDMYQTEEEHPALELEAIMLNVNRNHNPELMAACKTLRDYAEYTDRVRRYKDEYETLEEAVERAIDECIEEGVLADFLRRHRAEVISVSIYEFIDDEKFLKMQREDAYEEGREEGRADGMAFGELKMLYELVRKDLISLKDAAREANQTEEEFEAGMKAYFAERESA